MCREGNGKWERGKQRIDIEMENTLYPPTIDRLSNIHIHWLQLATAPICTAYYQSALSLLPFHHTVHGNDMPNGRTYKKDNIIYKPGVQRIISTTSSKAVKGLAKYPQINQRSCITLTNSIAGNPRQKKKNRTNITISTLTVVINLPIAIHVRLAYHLIDFRI